MCLAIPAQIKEMNDMRGKVGLSGNIRETDLSLIDDPKIGDWVLLHAGFAIEKLDEEDALETLKMFGELEEAAGQIDES